MYKLAPSKVLYRDSWCALQNIVDEILGPHLINTKFSFFTLTLVLHIFRIGRVRVDVNKLSLWNELLSVEP
jgi:hypothetical protein